MGKDTALTKATAGQAAAVALSQLRAVPTFAQQEPEALEAPGVPPGARSRWNASGGGPVWGSPMHEVVSAEKRAPASPDSGPAWGRTVTISLGQQPAGCARVYLEKAEALTVTADVQSPAPWGADVDGLVIQSVFAWLKIVYGNGSASATKLCRVDAHFDTPLAGITFLDVYAFLGDVNGNPIPTATLALIKNNPTAQVAVQVNRGTRGLPIHATAFVAGAGVSSAVANAPSLLVPSRLESIAAHLTAAVAGDHFLQIFDATAVPSNNAVPLEEWPLGSTPTASAIARRERLISPRGVSRGLVYAVSTTAGLLTLATDGSSCWCSFEVQLL